MGGIRCQHQLIFEILSHWGRKETKVEGAGVHIRQDCLVDGMLDVTRFGLVTRLGYKDYSVIRDVFQMTRPGEA